MNKFSLRNRHRSAFVHTMFDHARTFERKPRAAGGQLPLSLKAKK